MGRRPKIRLSLTERRRAEAETKAFKALSVFASNVHYRREKLGMTQGQLAKTMNMSVSSISRYETGLIMPTVSVVNRFAEALGCHPADLLEWR